MTSSKFEERLNRINASVQPTGRKSGGGSGSWQNGKGATGLEPNFTGEAAGPETENGFVGGEPSGPLGRFVTGIWSRIRGFFLP